MSRCALVIARYPIFQPSYRPSSFASFLWPPPPLRTTSRKNCASAHPKDSRPWPSARARAARALRARPPSAPLAHPLPPAPQRVRLAGCSARSTARSRSPLRSWPPKSTRERVLSLNADVGAVLWYSVVVDFLHHLIFTPIGDAFPGIGAHLGSAAGVWFWILLCCCCAITPYMIFQKHMCVARRGGQCVGRCYFWPCAPCSIAGNYHEFKEVVGVRRRREAAGAAGAGAALRLADQDARVARRQGDHQLVRRVQGAGADVPQEEDDAALAQDRRPHGAHRRGDAHRVLLHRAPPQEWHRRLHPLQIRARPLGGGGDGVAPPPQADDPPRGAGPPPLDAQGAPSSADAPAHPADAPSGRPAPRARRRRRARRPEPSAPRRRHHRCAPSCGSSGTASPSTRR